MKKRYISLIMLAASLTITSCAGSNGAGSQAAPTEVSMAESEASTNAADAAEDSSASDASVTGGEVSPAGADTVPAGAGSPEDTSAAAEQTFADPGEEAEASGAAASESSAAGPAGEAAAQSASEGEPAETPDSEATSESEYYTLIRDAYKTQVMPDYFILPYVHVSEPAPRAPYESVTIKNLQGRWINSYREGGADYIEVLTVNGDRARIESYRNGIPTNAWNDEGTVSIEDRSDRGVCPAFRITDDEGVSCCTIYIRRVGEDSFFDGGFLNEWKREEPVNPEERYLQDTVSMDSLQGVWYTEYDSGGELAQVILHVDGGRASLFETIGYKPFDVWNGEGTAELTLAESANGMYVPYLLLHFDDGPAAGHTAGIYISSVGEDRFYDCGLDLWYMKVPEDYLKEAGDMELESPYTFTPLEDGGLRIDGIYSYEVRAESEVSDVGTAYEWNIDVTDTEGRSQTIHHTIDANSNYASDAYDILFEDDVNFDGATDIVLYKGTFGPQSVTYYTCYLAENGRFVHCDGFDEIPDPYPDAENGLIYGHVQDGAEAYYELSYRVQSRTAVPVGMHRYVYDEASGSYQPE